MNQSPQNLLANSDEIYSANAVSLAIDSLASQITEVLSKSNQYCDERDGHHRLILWL